jgi:hypothetical protein
MALIWLGDPDLVFPFFSMRWSATERFSCRRGVGVHFSFLPFFSMIRSATERSPKLDEQKHPADYHNALGQALDVSNGIEDPTAVIVQAALECGASTSRFKPEHSQEVVALFAARRIEMDPDARKDLSKKLWKLLRRERRQRHDDEFVRLANQGAGFSKLKQHQSRQSGIGRINSIRNSDGVVCNGQESICEVFAKFYEDLYSEMCETQLHEMTHFQVRIYRYLRKTWRWP